MIRKFDVFSVCVHVNISLIPRTFTSNLYSFLSISSAVFLFVDIYFELRATNILSDLISMVYTIHLLSYLSIMPFYCFTVYISYCIVPSLLVCVQARARLCVCVVVAFVGSTKYVRFFNTITTIPKSLNVTMFLSFNAIENYHIHTHRRKCNSPKMNEHVNNVLC